MNKVGRTRERRVASRRLLGMAAKIVTAGGQIFKCRIVDVSSGGALLSVPSVLAFLSVSRLWTPMAEVTRCKRHAVPYPVSGLNSPMAIRKRHAA